MQEVGRFFMRKLTTPAARAAGGGYAVLGLFVAALAVVRWLWSGVSDENALLLAALVAAPAALALVWNRLSGFKVYGLEVSLTHASTQLDAGLVDAVMVQYYSDQRRVIELISKTLIAQREEAVVEVPLRHPAKPYWWSTRLFLVAALVLDYARVHAFVFVDGDDDDRHFLGLATPANVRLAIGRQFPSLEEVYAKLKSNLDQTMPATQQVERMFESWSTSSFSQKEGQVNEQEFRSKVNRFSLLEWMATVGGLDDRRVRWRGFQDRDLLKEIVDFEGPYVPLVQYGRLYKVVRRQSVLEEVAAKALR